MVSRDAACGAKCVERLASAGMLHSQPHYLTISIVDHQQKGGPSLTHGATSVDRKVRVGCGWQYPQRPSTASTASDEAGPAIRQVSIRTMPGTQRARAWADRPATRVEAAHPRRRLWAICATPRSQQSGGCLRSRTPLNAQLRHADLGRRSTTETMAGSPAYEGCQKAGPIRACIARSPTRLVQGENAR